MLAVGLPAQDAHGFSGSSSVAGALKLVQIPAGARHIQVEELEKVPHHIGECQGARRWAARPWDLPSGVGGAGRAEERILMQRAFHEFE